MELPDYQLSRHAQAKRLRLSVDSLGNIKVTAPRRIAKYVVDEFVLDNLEWIETASLKQKDLRLSHPNLGLAIPQSIHLKSQNSKLNVSPLISQKNACIEQSDVLYLYAKSELHYLANLKKWLKTKAKEFLSARLSRQAEIMGLEYNQVFIKNQKTRWGSCSSRKNINLNQNLIFFDLPLVDYLLVHELSHIKFPNHSAAFWRHVEQYDNDYKRHDKLLNQAGKEIPLWALQSTK